ncbi:MAG: tRNA (guanosine(37)-N1)-methyltransferase TrmD [Clostridia bacterium]
MKIDVLTLFPEMFDALNHSILKRALENELFELNVVNIRDYATNKHKKCDDYPFGGGAGMVMMPQPIYDALEAVDFGHTARRIYMSPQGQVFSHKKGVELANCDHIVFLCGHYEGIDERILENCIDEELSIGDYVLTGGELPAMVVIDSLARQIPNVLDSESLLSESFTESSLEYPQYTRPAEFNGLKVPEVLLSGNHQDVDKWREKMKIEVTKKKRPDLIKGETK